jgi:hypothetical protein
MTFPLSLTADDREAVRQIAMHFDCKYKVFADGNEKEIKIMKPDFTSFNVIEAEQDAKTREIESLKDALLQCQLCLSLTQKTLSSEQRSNKLLSKEALLRKRLSQDPGSDAIIKQLDALKDSPRKLKSTFCSHCDKLDVSHAVFPCGHLFCQPCAEEARIDRDCHECSGTVEGVLVMEIASQEPHEPKRQRTQDT